MYRNAIEKLKLWKEDIERKPLILKGARQVGKTYLLKEFAKNYYKNFVYINFDTEEQIKDIFKKSKDPQRIITELSLVKDLKIEPKHTLIIFDEVQECPEALNSLKYFYEEANQYHITAAGSLLGTLLAKPKSYPVGMVDILHVYPLTFDEFLRASDESLFKYYSMISVNDDIIEIMNQKLLDAFNQYLIIGGMPQVVNSWLNTRDPIRISNLQNTILEIYENDFSKHNGSVNSGRILLAFRSLVPQLSKENEKFIYGVIRQGARAREFEEAVEWIVSAGLVNRVYNVSQAQMPLKAYDILNCFKLFSFDTGLLKQMAGIPNQAIILDEPFQFKGPLIENFVLQQLNSQFDFPPRYFADNNSEIDFLIQNQGQIIPIEVKAGTDKSAPSFKRFIDKNNAKLGIRFSKRNLKQDGAILNVPLYLAPRLQDLLKITLFKV